MTTTKQVIKKYKKQKCNIEYCEGKNLKFCIIGIWSRQLLLCILEMIVEKWENKMKVE